VEVLSNREYQRLILWDALDLVSPLARNLDGGLHCLSSGIHWQDHVKPKQLGCILGEAWKNIIVECSTAKGKPRCLLGQGLDELGVAVALVYSRVCGEKVQIVFPLRVPDTGAAGS
jgi:hypothetical protein